MPNTRPLKELTAAGQLRRLNVAAQASLADWGMQDAKVFSIHHGENATFRVEYGSERFLLRLARPGYHTDAQLISEATWLRALVDDGFTVPDPVPHSGGLLGCAHPEGGEGRQVMLFRWVPGRFRYAHSAIAFEKTGRLMADLHAHARAFKRPKGFARAPWNAATMLRGEGPFLPWTAAEMSDKQRAVLTAGQVMLEEKLAKMERTGPTLLIHADLHRGNRVFDARGAYAIDFDDCGDGHIAQDVSTALPATWSDEFPSAWSAFLRGYRSVYPSEPFDVTMLTHQNLARELQMVGWLVDRSRDVHRLATYIPNKINVLVEQLQLRL